MLYAIHRPITVPVVEVLLNLNATESDLRSNALSALVINGAAIAFPQLHWWFLCILHL